MLKYLRKVPVLSPGASRFDQMWRRREPPHWIGIKRVEPTISGKWLLWFKKIEAPETHRLAKQRRLNPGLFRHDSYLHLKTTGCNRSKPAWAVLKVEIRWLPVKPRYASKRADVALTLWAADECRSNNSGAIVCLWWGRSVDADSIRKPYFKHAFIFKTHLTLVIFVSIISFGDW